MYIYDRRFVVVLVFVFCKFAIVNLYSYICVYKFVFEYLYVDICICIFVCMCKSSYCSVVCPNLRCGPIWTSPLLGTSRRLPLSNILRYGFVSDVWPLAYLPPRYCFFQLLAMFWWICAHDLISCMEVCDEKKGKWNDLKYGSVKKWKIWKIWRELECRPVSLRIVVKAGLNRQRLSETTNGPQMSKNGLNLPLSDNCWLAIFWIYPSLKILGLLLLNFPLSESDEWWIYPSLIIVGLLFSEFTPLWKFWVCYC